MILEALRRSAIEADVRRMVAMLDEQNRMLGNWPSPLTSEWIVEWEKPMSYEYIDHVEAARNATIEECASHLVAVQMDHAEAYAEELRTMKRYAPQRDEQEKKDPGPQSEVVIVPWSVYYQMATEMAEAIGGPSVIEYTEEIAKGKYVIYLGKRFEPEERPEHYRV